MDKYTWRQVKALSSSSHKPSARWGHSCCIVGEDIVFFGGYADSNYMNDLWAFNSVTMKWRQIETKGDIPAQRSNCSMNYDSENNQIVIFGGGGSNKQRFNSISILNWATKDWVEITPKQNQTAPWERTYHVAELIFPFLIVFGGEGVADMDDLWVFNFKTLCWTEIKTPQDKPKPCARRFHSSVKIGNEFFVLAGCHGKYRCLSDVFSMDFTPLIKTGKTDLLQWKQKKLKNSSFLTRWGHSSSVYDNKIYIFGGRFSNDLNDILVADFESNSIRQLKITGEAPAARRRHCAGFIGSSMLAFGGFNGQYFNDLHYISVHEARPKYETGTISDEKQFLNFINNKEFANYIIKSKDNSEFYINVGMILKYFENEHQLNDFLLSIESEYTVRELENIFKTLYTGLEEEKLDEELKSKLKYPIFESKLEKLNFERESIEKPNMEDWERKMIKKSVQGLSPTIKLNEEAFTEYFMDVRNRGLFDFQIVVGRHSYPVNRTKTMAKSQFFMNLLSISPTNDTVSLPNVLGEDSRVVYEIFFNFIDTDWLVVPDNVSCDTFLHLITLADYFCVPLLAQLCSNQLLSSINIENIDKILNHAITLKLTNLSRACCDFWVKKASQTVKLSELKIEIGKHFVCKKAVQQLEAMVEKIRFDLAQVLMENEKNVAGLGKKSLVGNFNVEKQNYETNVYNH